MTRVSIRAALSRHDLGLVAVALTVAMISRRLMRVRQDLVCLGCFRGHGWRVGMCPRAECWFYSWTLDLVELLPHVFDSAGSAGVVFGLTRIVVEAFTLFRCFFLLLWLVRDWLSLLSLVREAHPPTLFRSPDPDEAENWQEEIERIFQVMQCTNKEKVVLATFQFTKDARAWWKATSAHLPNVGELEWAGFLEIFRGKYFSERVKEKKAAEFAALKNKGMFVAEYEAQFARLAVYAPHLVGTERLKANRFMDGLRP
ncbi:hypothetical protein Taro_053118, partial [Colocasia esculenta]|nr:hypothetical protein [Colocasia esculenta]